MSYFANCSKCQWLWPFLLSKPIVPARTRPMTLPPLQKYWYAFMTGEACDRNPSTSSGPLPPTHTVAPKSRKSWVCLRGWLTLIDQAGSATRSGSADGGGFCQCRDAGRGPR